MTPFVPYLFTSPGGVWYVFHYHLERPLQIESVLGTPMLVAGALGWAPLEIGYSHGSHQLIATGARRSPPRLSGVLTVLAVLGTYGLLLAAPRRPSGRRRRSSPSPSSPCSSRS